MPRASKPRSGRGAKPSGPASALRAARGPQLDRADFPIVAIGASAGGLDAVRKLLDAMPGRTGMAFIFVQHLDPYHDSLLVELLASHTSMTVSQAADGEGLAPDHVYVIPPGATLVVEKGIMRVSEPEARHGTRLPFDALLRSLAEDCAERSAGVILSGTGADGSEGALALKARGGFIIAQDPDEAEYDGMPHSALLTGAVDLTLKVADIPSALSTHRGRPPAPAEAARDHPESPTPDQLSAIVDLMLTRTTHDFRLYKEGTLRRRIERRMAMGGRPERDMAAYLKVLESDPVELDRLATDLLINVTSFFRDKTVFDALARTTIPELVRSHGADDPLRIWVAGCSTGEEAYSLAMLVREEIEASRLNVKVQIFASDVDADAVAMARDGLYPPAIAAEISPERLARFFSKDEQGYRVSSELRSNVVFTVHDVLSDPPFSRMDLISCRNLLIYLGPEAQAKVISRFQFALRPGGLLLLGSFETAGNIEGRFEVASKEQRLYRVISRPRPGDIGFALGKPEFRAAVRPQPVGAAPSPEVALSEFVRQAALKAFAPALVLINRKLECLYFLGATERYLHHAEGHPTNDLIGMVPQEWRTKLRAAIRQASPEHTPVHVDTSFVDPSGTTRSCTIEVRSLARDGEELLLVAFLEPDPAGEGAKSRGKPVVEISAGHQARIADLERELENTRTELHAAIRNLDLSRQEQRVVTEEALSVNEEFQSTNEELLTSKEELQSLNEELTALNTQLQESLDRQRTTSSDLQNVLYSTDVATLFLDRDLNIRFFTPATRSLFNLIPSDVGRPLSDLRSLASDKNLADDARAVLTTHRPIDREIETDPDTWFVRRILPYRNQNDLVEGVVITFNDVSERKRIRKALEQAKLEAEQADRAKSRFLAAASHDLRQPLQTIAFVQGLLARTVTDEKAKALVKRLEETLHAMSGMLNALLDINQIEAGTIRPATVSFSLNDLFDRLRDEFTYLAEAKSLVLRVVPSNHFVHTDPRLLEQILRNLLTNAIEYTRTGKVLMGSRRRRGGLSIEIWDTGIGIPDAELQTIFEEYHQLDNAARERSRGLGLGLSIVQRLADVLGYKIHVRSRLGKGSVFAVEIALPMLAPTPPDAAVPGAPEPSSTSSADAGSRTILVVEDDPDVRDLLALLLEAEGHDVTAAFDGRAALDLVRSGTVKPDLVISDYNLPNGMDGLQVAAELRGAIGKAVPVVILTGDIASKTLTEIARHNCTHLGKPVKPKTMLSVLDKLLSASSPEAPPVTTRNARAETTTDTIYVVDDDPSICETLRDLLQGHGYAAATFETGEAFLAQHRAGRGSCVLIDARLPGMDGFALLKQLKAADRRLPAIMITGNGDVPMAVQAMKAGAVDFIEKPVSPDELLASVARALEQARDAGQSELWRKEAEARLATLTVRQREIMDLILAGHPNKNIAADLGLSQRTVENHRNAIMKRTACTSLPALARLAVAAAPNKDWGRPRS
jgi:two-component system CheB/CheR fusion protein